MPKLAQFSSALADFTREEMRARGGEGTSSSSRSEPSLGVLVVWAEVEREREVVGWCHGSPPRPFESLLALVISPSAISSSLCSL